MLVVGKIVGEIGLAAIQTVVVNAAYLLVTGTLNPFGTFVAAVSGVGLEINTVAVGAGAAHVAMVNALLDAVAV